jgi:hypothetical protein
MPALSGVAANVPGASTLRVAQRTPLITTPGSVVVEVVVPPLSSSSLLQPAAINVAIATTTKMAARLKK